MGQKHHFDRQPFTSAAPRSTDIAGEVGMSQRCQRTTSQGWLIWKRPPTEAAWPIEPFSVHRDPVLGLATLLLSDFTIWSDPAEHVRILRKLFREHSAL
jgi:hypothetical protein